MKLLKDPLSTNLEQFGLRSTNTLKCINSFRAFGTLHRQTQMMSLIAAFQALISVQAPSLLNSRSFSSKNSLTIQRWAQRGLPTHQDLCSPPGLNPSRPRAEPVPLFPPHLLMFHTGSSRGGKQPTAEAPCSRTHLLTPGYCLINKEPCSERKEERESQARYLFLFCESSPSVLFIGLMHNAFLVE